MLKRPAGGGDDGGAAGPMRVEKPEKMEADIQALELIDELKLARTVVI